MLAKTCEGMAIEDVERYGFTKLAQKIIHSRRDLNKNVYTPPQNGRKI
jgi:hypothetical protein